MKDVQTTIYEAFDGKRFLTEQECNDYESAHWHHQLVGLTIEDVDAALDRTNVDRADAFEKAGQRIARKRLADGERRRTVKREPNVPDNADALARVAASKPEPIEPSGIAPPLGSHLHGCAAGYREDAPCTCRSIGPGPQISTNPEDRHDPPAEQDMGGPAAGEAA